MIRRTKINQKTEETFDESRIIQRNAESRSTQQCLPRDYSSMGTRFAEMWMKEFYKVDEHSCVGERQYQNHPENFGSFGIDE